MIGQLFLAGGDLLGQTGRVDTGQQVARRNLRRRVAVAGLHSLVGRLIEEGKKLIVFLLRNRVELVRVTLAALHRQPQPDVGRGLDAVDDILDAILLGDRPALVGRAVIAIEPGGNLLGDGRAGQQIAGQLFDRELIERHVRIVRPNDPIAPGPHVARAVGVMHAGVSVTGRVHPPQRHPLAVMPRGQQPVDDFLIGAAALVGLESVDLIGRRRQAGQVEADAPQ